MTRKRMKKRRDRRVFAATANKGKAVNITYNTSRGGILF